ncbi:MAG: winged helix DNA-binding domain-containing protein [Actinomycetota bacterium]
MPARSRVTTEERRARLAVRHRLAPRARVDDDVAAIARSLVALHATDPMTVVLSALVRMRTPDQALVEAALFEDRTVARVMAMRRTLWVAPVESLPVLQSAAADGVAAAERRRLVKLLEDAGVADDGEAWLAEVEPAAIAAFEDLGEAAATHLADTVPALATRVTLAAGKGYETTTSLASRLLTVLGAEGHLVRGRPKGRWTGTQHHWALARRWLGEQPPPPPAEEGRAQLAQAWLARFGPATVADLRWWTGWTLGQTRAALARLETVEVDLDGETGIVLVGDTEPTPTPDPWVALLPSLDPTVMGWQARDWYLGEHRGALFDAYGNAGPTIWVDGRAVGAWGQRPDGEVVTRLLEDVGTERAEAISTEAARTRAMLGDIVIKPRFSSAVSKDLAR